MSVSGRRPGGRAAHSKGPSSRPSNEKPSSSMGVGGGGGSSRSARASLDRRRDEEGLPLREGVREGVGVVPKEVVPDLLEAAFTAAADIRARDSRLSLRNSSSMVFWSSVEGAVLLSMRVVVTPGVSVISCPLKVSGGGVSSSSLDTGPSWIAAAAASAACAAEAAAAAAFAFASARAFFFFHASIFDCYCYVGSLLDES